MFWRTQGTITAPKPPTTNVQGSPVVGDGAVSPTAWSGIAGNFLRHMHSLLHLLLLVQILFLIVFDYHPTWK